MPERVPEQAQVLEPVLVLAPEEEAEEANRHTQEGGKGIHSPDTDHHQLSQRSRVVVRSRQLGLRQFEVKLAEKKLPLGDRGWVAFSCLCGITSEIGSSGKACGLSTIKAVTFENN